MLRNLIRLVLTAVLLGGLLRPAGAQRPIEKTDASVDRSLTGFVQEVRASDEHHGVVVFKSSGVRDPAALNNRGASASRSAICSGERTVTRVAANSRASGIPATWRQI